MAATRGLITLTRDVANNRALENLPFKHDWVFIQDADEVFPPQPVTEETRKKLRPEISAYDSPWAIGGIMRRD